MNFDLDNLVRPNIARLTPYSSARSEFAGAAEIFLDANENAFGSPAGDDFNRYPDPLQKNLKQKIGVMKGTDPSQIFVGNGSDEAIDLLFRIFCEPGKDACIVCPPTYGMYRVSANINDVEVIEVPLTSEFQLNVEQIIEGISQTTKMIFICSPNNPTGNLIRREDIISVAKEFKGIVVVDEAYIDYAGDRSIVVELPQLPNLVVLQTFSKAWGMAGLRVGLGFANRRIIDLMNRVKPPYNISAIAQNTVLAALDDRNEIETWVTTLLDERRRLIDSLSTFGFVQTIYPTDANFILVRTDGASAIYQYLLDQGIVVRDRSKVEMCEGCLRVTVGTTSENSRLLDAFEQYEERN